MMEYGLFIGSFPAKVPKRVNYALGNGLRMRKAPHILKNTLAGSLNLDQDTAKSRLVMGPNSHSASCPAVSARPRSS